MFFCIYEYYDDNQQDIKENYNECFICFEYKTDLGNKPYNLLNQKFYLINCACNPAVHEYCLKIWIDRNKSCPICRTEIIENNNIYIFICNFIPYGISIYTFVKNLSIRFIKDLTFIVIVFLYTLIDFIINMIRTRYILENTLKNDYYYRDGYIPYYNHKLNNNYVHIPILQDNYFNQSSPHVS
jgi:hypothetical protein